MTSITLKKDEAFIEVTSCSGHNHGFKNGTFKHASHLDSSSCEGNLLKWLQKKSMNRLYLYVYASGHHVLHVSQQALGFDEVRSWRVLKGMIAFHRIREGTEG